MLAIRRTALLLALSLGACALDLDLPPAPEKHAPAPERVEPAQAFAGNVVTITGTHLGGRTTDVTVAFGDVVTRPFEASPDGTRLKVVVPDAAFGAATLPVLVTTGAGSTPAPAPLTYRGGDRLRMGTLAGVRPVGELFVRSAGLPAPEAAIVVASRLLEGSGGMFSEDLLSLTTLRQEGSSVLQTRRRARFVALDSSSDGSVVIAASLGTNETCKAGELTIDFLDGAQVAEHRVANALVSTACLATNDYWTRLSLSNDGTRLLVLNDGRAWVVGADGHSLELAAPAGGHEYLDGVVLEGDRFALITGTSIGEQSAIELATRTGELSTRVPATDFEPLSHDFMRLAAGPGGLLFAQAVLEIAALDTSTWPPKRVRQLKMESASASELCLSADGTTLATLDSASTLRLYDLTRPTPLPTATRKIRGATSLRPDAFGTFLVRLGTRLERISGATGATLSSRTINAQPATLAWIPVASEEADDGEVFRWDLVVAGLRHGESARLRSSQLLDPGAFDLPRWAAGGAGSSRHARLSSDGSVQAFETVKDTLVIVRRGKPAQPVPIPSEDLPISGFDLSPDGRAVLVLAGGTFTPWHVRVFAIPDEGVPSERAHFELEGFGNTVYELRAFAGGRAIVGDLTHRLLFDWDERATDATRRRLVTFEGETARGFALPRGYLAIGPGNRLDRLDLETGQVTPAGALPAALPVYGRTATSPGGTRLYWVVEDKLVVVALDPISGRVSHLEPPVDLPVGTEAWAIAAAPDGEGLAIADVATDAILIVR